MAFTVADVVSELGGVVRGYAQLRIDRIASLSIAGANDISFLSNERYAKQLKTSHAGCVILTAQSAVHVKHWPLNERAWIETDAPYLYFAKLTQWWKSRHAASKPVGIHPSAVIDPSAQIDSSASIGALCVI